MKEEFQRSLFFFFSPQRAFKTQHQTLLLTPKPKPNTNKNTPHLYLVPPSSSAPSLRCLKQAPALDALAEGEWGGGRETKLSEQAETNKPISFVFSLFLSLPPLLSISAIENRAGCCLPRALLGWEEVRV